MNMLALTMDQHPPKQYPLDLISAAFIQSNKRYAVKRLHLNQLTRNIFHSMPVGMENISTIFFPAEKKDSAFTWALGYALGIAEEQKIVSAQAIRGSHSATRNWLPDSSQTIDSLDSLLASALYTHDNDGELARTFRSTESQTSQTGSAKQLLYFIEAKRHVGNDADSYRAESGEAVIELICDRGRLTCVIGHNYFNVMAYVTQPKEDWFQKYSDGSGFSLQKLIKAIDQAREFLA